MSRIRHFTFALGSGYMAMAANVVFTLGSVPVALHYLSKEEFGLWAVVMQISGYLILTDLGMAGSISRILIDYKDRLEGGGYGAVIKTGALVLAVQGVIIGVVGAALSWWLPDLFDVPARLHHDFQLLVAGQCLLMGALSSTRIFGHLLLAHQRFDNCNYSQVVFFLVNFGAMWLGFQRGFGIYSLLLASVAGNVATTAMIFLATVRLHLYPPPGLWGRARRDIFLELFAYGRDVFLLSIGQQLISASQVLIVSRSLGLDAAAVWSIATKSFTLAQQVVFRILDFSGPAFSEMIVRGERARLVARFRDLVILTASFGAWVGLTAGLCNGDFLAVWTKGRIDWGAANDWMMALLLIVNSLTRCHIGFIGITKEIRAMKFVYFLEGAGFVTLGFLVAPRWGMTAFIGCAAAMNLACSGVYGVWRTHQYFSVPLSEMVGEWLRLPLRFLLALAALLAVTWLATNSLPPLDRLAVRGSIAVLAGLLGFWKLGLTRALRTELSGLLAKILGRLRGISPA